MIFDLQPLTGTMDLDVVETTHTQPQRLYRLWEEGNWSASAIDFTQDALDWRQKLTEEQQRALLWQGSLFLHGERDVNIALAPFIAAAPRSEDKLFLSTQLADEARHHMFFDRFLREVCGIGDNMTSTLELTQQDLPKNWVLIFQELDLLTKQLNRCPQDTSLLAQGITLYHLVVEGLLASVGLQYLYNYIVQQQLLRGLAQGLQMIMRDESRHIAFGIYLLRTLLETNAQTRVAVLDMLNRVLPWTAIGYMPEGKGWTYFTSLGYSPQEYYATGLRFLEKRLEHAGIRSAEVLTLIKLGYPDSVEKQSKRLVSYLETGILNNNDQIQLTEETIDMLFESLQNVALWSWQRQRDINLKIQWILLDAQPRYLLYGSDTPPAIYIGRLAKPDLTIFCSASNWARIAGEQFSFIYALLSRRLHVTGDLLPALQFLEVLQVHPQRNLWSMGLLKTGLLLRQMRRLLSVKDIQTKKAEMSSESQLIKEPLV